MASINVEKLSLKELVALESKIQTALVEARKKAQGDVKQKLSTLAEEHGFSLSELFGATRGRGNGKKMPVGVAKYANPEDKSDTWTGRGRKPNWLVARLKKGASLKDFAI